MQRGRDNFESWPPLQATTVGTPSQDAAVKFTGAASMSALAGATRSAFILLPEKLEHTFFYREVVYVDSFPTVSNMGVGRINRASEATMLEPTLRIEEKFSLWNPVAAANVGSSSPKLTIKTFYVFEVSLKVAAAGNSEVAWRILNGDGSVFHPEQKATVNVGNTAARRFSVGNVGNHATGGIHVDAMGINCDEYAVDNSWLGATVGAPPAQPAPTACYWGATMDGDVGILEGTGERGDAPFPGTGTTTWNLFEEHAGREVGIVQMGNSNWTWSETGPAACIARGAIPLISLATPGTVKEINEGTKDALIEAWAAKAKEFGHPLFARPFWEFNVEGFTSWDWAHYTATEFVAAWKRIVDLIRSAGASNVTFVWSINHISFGSNVIDPGPWYPGDDYVDWTSIDGYVSTQAEINYGWTTAFRRFKYSYDRLREIAPDKPIQLSEVGASETGGSKPEWITELFDIIETDFPQIKGVFWFNSYILHGAERATWPIESSKASEEAFEAAVAAPFYEDPEVAFFPALTKVPEPGEVEAGTLITSGPGTSEDTSAVIEFIGDPAATSFEGSIDGGPWVTIASPWMLVDLAPGSHTVEVRGVLDLPDATPASWSWTVLGDRTLTAAARSRLEELPGWAQEAPEHQALCQVFAKEGERQRALAREVRDGLIPIKANALTLPLWETVLKLTVNPAELSEAQRRELVITRLLQSIPDPSGKTWQEQVTAFLGPGWSHEEEEPQTIRVKVPIEEGSSDFLQAERILRIKIPAAWALIVESGENFNLDQSKLDEQAFHSTP